MRKKFSSDSHNSTYNVVIQRVVNIVSILVLRQDHYYNTMVMEKGLHKVLHKNTKRNPSHFNFRKYFHPRRERRAVVAHTIQYFKEWLKSGFRQEGFIVAVCVTVFLKKHLMEETVLYNILMKMMHRIVHNALILWKSLFASSPDVTQLFPEQKLLSSLGCRGFF